MRSAGLRMEGKKCTTCRQLENCSRVTEEMLAKGDSCSDWSGAPCLVSDARNKIIEDMGPWALRFDVRHLVRKSAARKRSIK